MPLQVTNNTKQNCFESTLDGETAVLTYEIKGNRITLTHTRVPKAIENRGVGTNLVEAALSFAREHHLQVIPECPFVAKYIAEHSEHQSLLAKK
jgi:predicted GNAT family acetyltransferase